MRLSAYTIFLFLFACFSTAYASDIAKRLDKLKKEDKLVDWIDLRLDFTSQNPKKNLNFLLESQQKVWRKPGTLEEHISWVYLLINQGYYQLYNGNILQSIDKYEEAYAYSQKYNLEIDIEEYILKPLANNYTRTGDYERAIFIQQQSLDLALKQKTDTLIASIHNNLAISYRFSGNLEKAIAEVKSGLSYCNKQNHIYGVLLSTFADIQFENRNYKEALEYANRAIKSLSGKKNTSYWLSGAHGIAGNIHLYKNDLDKANEHFDRALYIMETEFARSRKRELAHLLTLKSKVLLDKGNYQKAMAYSNQAIETLIPEFTKGAIYPSETQLYAEYKLRAALIQKAEIFKRLGDESGALSGYQLAFEVSEKLRTEYTYTSSKKQLQEDSKQLAEDIIEIAYSLWNKTKKKEYAELILITCEQTKARLLFDELNYNRKKAASGDKNYAELIRVERALAYYERQKRTENNIEGVDKKIAELKFRLSSLKKKENIKNTVLDRSVKALLANIPEDTKAIIFFAGYRNNYIIDAGKGGINRIKRLENAAHHEQQITSFLSEFFYNGPSNMMNNPKRFFNHSFQIYHSIFEGIDMSSHANLLVIKDGVYNYLSFDGLITSNEYSGNIRTWPYFIKQKPIRYQYSLYNFETGDSSKPNHSFTGFFLSNTENNSIEIPSVIYEHRELKKLITGDFYLNKEADAQNLKLSLLNSNVLHLSSHAYVTTNQEPVIELFKDKFYLFELSSYSLPELVILNACQTADGKYTSGEGVESMTRGFLASGSKAVISGLWNINDETGAYLLVSYYQRLLKNNKTFDALREAKLNWIESPESNNILALPYYWDSLIYTGKELEISLQKKSYDKLLYLSALAILGGAVFLITRVKNRKSG